MFPFIDLFYRNGNTLSLEIETGFSVVSLIIFDIMGCLKSWLYLSPYLKLIHSRS